MKRLLITSVVLFSLVVVVQAQSDYNGFYEKSTAINKTGMYVLGGWAIANIASGAVGWSKTRGSTMRFHQMNLFWNTVNLTIAGVALYNYLNTSSTALNPETIMQQHRKAEKLYLINAGLDMLYVGTGFFLKHLSTKKTKKEDLLLGYGNSVILQGAFLFVFDAVMWVIQRNNRLNFAETVRVTFAAEYSGIKLGITIPF